MMSWYIFAILALLFIGMQRFLYKVSAERNCNTAWTTFYFMATVTILSTTLFILQGAPVYNHNFLFLIAIVNSTTFLATTISQIEALKRLPASTVYPLIRLSLVLVVIFSLIFFEDTLSEFQLLGILFAIIAIAILTRQFSSDKNPGKNIKYAPIFVFIAVLSSSISTISSKFAALYTNKMAFIALSYAASTIFSFGLRNKLHNEKIHSNHKEAFVIGCIIGFINFAGFYLYLKALSEGPLSIVASIVGMHFVISVILSSLIYREKLSPLQKIGISLTIFSIILLRL